MRRSLGVLGLACALIACGPRPQRDPLGPGQQHVGAAGRAGDGAAQAAPEARRKLAAAVTRGDVDDVVRWTVTLDERGEPLTEPERAAALAAVEAAREEVVRAALDGKTLSAWLHQALCARGARLFAHQRAATSGDLGAWCGDQPADRAAVAARPRSPLIAVLLPLSGAHGALGRELRDSIRLAARGVAGVELRFFDTTGMPAVAAQAVRDADRADAALVLGPVGELESRSALDAALDVQMPIALLTPVAGGGSRRDGLFRLWSAPSWEAEESARLAAELGYDRVAVFAPRDEVGELQARAFILAAQARGLSVLVDDRYDPTSSDLEPDVKRLLGLDPKTNDRLRAHLRSQGKKGWQSFSPDVEFSLLYIPDAYHRAALVASYLPYFNVELRSTDLTDVVALRKKHRGRVPQVVQLLGSSGWHHPGLITRGGSAVEGALVVDFFPGSAEEEFSSSAAAEFAAGFGAQYGRFPSAVAAQAFDAATIAVKAVRAAAGRDSRRVERQRVIDALARAALPDGVCGEARVGVNAELLRAASLLRVEDGSFVVHLY